MFILTRREEWVVQGRAKQHIMGERPVYPHRSVEGCQVDRGEIEQFLTAYGQLDRVAGTFYFYQRKLWKFYEDLPEDKTIRYGTLENWQKKLLDEGYAPNTVNSFLSAANAFVDYIGHREFQMVKQLKDEGKPPPPELSRAEYLHLLQTAKAMGKERAYLLMKVFATVGLLVQDLHELTVETVREGRIVCGRNRKQQILTVPKCLQKELLSYTDRNGIRTGPVFVGKDGRPMHRSLISVLLKPVSEAAQITDGRVTPKCLRRLYLSTRAAIENNVALLVEQAMERQLEKEQFSIGWEEL